MMDLQKLPGCDDKVKKFAGCYSVNGMFGTENTDSVSRVVLTTKSKATKKLCDKIIEEQIKKVSEFTITVKES